MKKTITIYIAFLMAIGVFAQAPQKMSYQAIIRNLDATLLVNTKLGMKISILKGTTTGTVVYSETHTATTNGNGLVSIQIGTGAVKSGSFSAINWASGPYFIKTETDPIGGTNYSITSTSQLVSVPYALHAKTAENLSANIVETDPSVPSGNVKGDIQYWNGSAWTTLAPGSNGQVLTMVAGVPKWVAVKDCNGVEGGTAYLDKCNICVGGNTGKVACVPPAVPSVINPITGKTWMDRNLGASQVATSNADAAAYGDLYQWGRGTDGHEKRTSGTTNSLSSTDSPGHSNFIISGSNDWRSTQNDNLWQGVNGINNPCPSGYRIPTAVEWEAEIQTWDTNNGAYTSPLKLTFTGSRVGIVSGEGSNAFYWSSTVNGINVHILASEINSAGVGNYGIRAFGHSVRCIKD